MSTETVATAEVLELAQLLHLQNCKWMRRNHPGMQLLSWDEMEKYGKTHVKDQWIDVATFAISWAALDRFPTSAIECPIPVPSLRQRMLKRLAAFDSGFTGWILIAFALGLIATSAIR